MLPCRVLGDPSFRGTVFVPVDKAWINLLRVLGRDKGWLLSDAERKALVMVLQARGGAWHAYSLLGKGA